MITIVLGTRPEIIKMSPVIRACQRNYLPFTILHTGQHYSYELDRIFFEELGLPEATYNLDVGSGTHAEQTGAIIRGVEKVLNKDPPDVVLVQGDTNTVMASALAAVKLQIPVGHVEAGLRSNDRSMPEEINRIVADHVSDYLFVPTSGAKENLIHEGIDLSTIFITGNTIVDAVLQNRELAEQHDNVLNTFDCTKDNYMIVTVHRPENVDHRERLQGILTGLQLLQTTYDLPILFPIHPRTRIMIDQFHLDVTGITLLPPLGYLEFLLLETHARLLLTDSGGVQEEACILGVPCVTLRDSTERPETIEVGANTIAGTRSEMILRESRNMLARNTKWDNPFGDGTAAEKIITIISELPLRSHGV